MEVFVAAEATAETFFEVVRRAGNSGIFAEPSTGEWIRVSRVEMRWRISAQYRAGTMRKA
jgi:hypothetical protein